MKFLSRTFVLLVLAAGAAAHGEIFNLTDVSDVFDFRLNVSNSTNEDGHAGINLVTITVSNKLTKTITQTIQSGPLYLFPAGFTGSDFAESYSTGKKRTNAAQVDDKGSEFIVADFNFDHREDFALRTGDRATSAPSTYDFYIQNKAGQFVRDAFLSDEMVIFPEINQSNKTLITCDGSLFDPTRRTYKLNAVTKKWREIKIEKLDEQGMPIEQPHYWTVFIGDYCFGLVCYPSKTLVFCGGDGVAIPFHAYTLMGIGSVVPLLVCAIYVYSQRRRHRRIQTVENRITVNL